MVVSLMNTKSNSGRLVGFMMPLTHLLALALVFLFTPHTLSIESSGVIDDTFVRYTLVALIWTVSYTVGSSFVGPYSRMDLLLPNPIQLIWSAIALPLSFYLLRVVWQYVKGENPSRFRLKLLLVGLAMLVIFLGFSYSLDAWYVILLFPFPLLQLVGAFLLYRYYSGPS
ncbi:MAG: hypothetical protein ACW99G_16515 [Candidatus Thorarchaeota archaeon]|jgi:hypothetical protein